MLTTTKIEQQLFNLDATNDIELDLDSILAVECDRGSANDIQLTF